MTSCIVTVCGIVIGAWVGTMLGIYLVGVKAGWGWDWLWN